MKWLIVDDCTFKVKNVNKFIKELSKFLDKHAIDYHYNYEVEDE